MPYTHDPKNSTTDAVRLYIGDTDNENPLLSDYEIEFALTQAGNVTIDAAIVCCKLLSAQHAGKVDTTIESVSVKHSQLSEKYTKLAGDLEAIKSKLSGSGVVAAECVLTGVSVSEMDTARADTDRVASVFDQGQFANPENDTRLDY